jgi:hypothetical protein
MTVTLCATEPIGRRGSCPAGRGPDRTDDAPLTSGSQTDPCAEGAVKPPGSTLQFGDQFVLDVQHTRARRRGRSAATDAVMVPSPLVFIIYWLI